MTFSTLLTWVVVLVFGMYFVMIFPSREEKK